MKIIVDAVKIAAKYNCDRCGNRRPMINDESVMEKTKKTKKFPISEILKRRKNWEQWLPVTLEKGWVTFDFISYILIF